ncbi:hypothetical protein BDN72DRAFT_855514 [Pluteus cervinus]|uniref:Uncharacterized protein n=1 Tax=Pluteus cervinus TaxID=181527 RepID=A0ACD3B2W8_9AGAR|nr:hypothetical protein BDN72DRAFT_855514 [Pluteus cervinus]
MNKDCFKLNEQQGKVGEKQGPASIHENKPNPVKGAKDEPFIGRPLSSGRERSTRYTEASLVDPFVNGIEGRVHFAEYMEACAAVTSQNSRRLKHFLDKSCSLNVISSTPSSFKRRFGSGKIFPSQREKPIKGKYSDLLRDGGLDVGGSNGLLDLLNPLQRLPLPIELHSGHTDNPHNVLKRTQQIPFAIFSLHLGGIYASFWNKRNAVNVVV